MKKIVLAALASLGLAISSATNSAASVSYCENDPGAGSSILYFEYEFYTGEYVYQCPPPGVLNPTEKAKCINSYNNCLYFADKALRLCTCDCWARYPSDPSARQDCRSQCLYDFEKAVEFTGGCQEQYRTCLPKCCEYIT